MKGRRASGDWQPAPSRRLAAAGPRDRDLSVVEQNCSGGSRPGRAKPIKHRKNCTCRGCESSQAAGSRPWPVPVRWGLAAQAEGKHAVHACCQLTGRWSPFFTPADQEILPTG